MTKSAERYLASRYLVADRIHRLDLRFGRWIRIRTFGKLDAFFMANTVCLRLQWHGEKNRLPSRPYMGNGLPGLSKVVLRVWRGHEAVWTESEMVENGRQGCSVPWGLLRHCRTSSGPRFGRHGRGARPYGGETAEPASTRRSEAAKAEIWTF